MSITLPFHKCRPYHLLPSIRPTESGKMAIWDENNREFREVHRELFISTYGSKDDPQEYTNVGIYIAHGSLYYTK